MSVPAGTTIGFEWLGSEDTPANITLGLLGKDDGRLLAGLLRVPDNFLFSDNLLHTSKYLTLKATLTSLGFYSPALTEVQVAPRKPLLIWSGASWAKSGPEDFTTNSALVSTGSHNGTKWVPMDVGNPNGPGTLQLNDGAVSGFWQSNWLGDLVDVIAANLRYLEQPGRVVPAGTSIAVEFRSSPDGDGSPKNFVTDINKVQDTGSAMRLRVTLTRPTAATQSPAFPGFKIDMVEA